MGCIVKSARLQDILDMVEAIVYDPDSNVNTYDDVKQYFADNFPQVSEKELAQAIMPLNDLKSKEIADHLKVRKDRLNRLEKSVNRLNDIVSKGVPEPGVRSVPDAEATEIANIIKDIRKLAGVDIKIPPEAYGDIVSRLENLTILQDAAFEFNGTDVTPANIKRIIEDARQIKKAAKIDEIQGKIKELDTQIEGLESGRTDIASIEKLDADLRFKGLDRDIAKKELELGEKRVELDIALNKARRKARAAEGFLGFKGKVARGITDAAMVVRDSAWEPWRALKFMADMSAWGVQAAPVVYSMMADVNLKRLVRGDLKGAFHSQRALSKIFYQTVGKIIVDSARNTSRWGKTAKSTYAQVLLNEIKNDPIYPIAIKSKLAISESGTLTSSEEVFTSNLINNVPIMGAIKDFSEDTMVSTLNALRMEKFRQFYESTNGTATLDEYARVAEVINKMTGTTAKHGQTARVLSTFLSAPKLMISRLALLTTEPFRALGGLDVPKSIKKRKFHFQTEGDRFIMNQMLKSVKGYVALTAAIAMLPNVEFEEDPSKKNFLRYRSGGLTVDATGGMGTLARTMLKAFYWATDWFPKGSDIREPTFGQNAITALMTGFIQYKLHPTINSAHQAITGKDFFGESFDLFGTKGAGPHVEGAMRAFLPILGETLIDDTKDVMQGKVKYGEALTEVGLNILGASTFIYESALSTKPMEEYFTALDYKPRTSYPDVLSDKEDSRTKDYLKSKYKDGWERVVEEFIKSFDYDPNVLGEAALKVGLKELTKQYDDEFVSKYSQDMSRLKTDVEKQRKKEKNKETAKEVRALQKAKK